MEATGTTPTAVAGTTSMEATMAATGTAAITTVATTTADIILTTRPSLGVSRFQSLSPSRFRSKPPTFGVQEFGVTFNAREFGVQRSDCWLWLLSSDYSKKMSHFGAFGLEVPSIVWIGFRFDRKLFHNVHAVSFKSNHLFGIVG